MTSKKHKPGAQNLGLRLRKELQHNAKHALDDPAVPTLQRSSSPRTSMAPTTPTTKSKFLAGNFCSPSHLIVT